jgi:hypothetical protein
MIKTILCFVLLITLAVSKQCNNDKECNIISPTKDIVETSQCIFEDGKGTCTTLKTTTHKSSPTAEQYCGDSFLVDYKCQKFAFAGCKLEKEAIQCFPGLSIENETCTLPTVKEKTYVEENEECNGDDKVCKFGLACIGFVCRKQLSAGSVCTQNKIPCKYGYICDLGRCVRAYSIEDWQPAEFSQSCKSAVLKNGFCYPQTRMNCFSNADCATGAFCKRKEFTGDEPGVCTNWRNYYYQELAQCYASCSGSDINTEKDCKCETALIKTKCAEACIKRKDERVLTNDFHKYDCKALTRDAFKEGDCEIAEQFSNCDSFFDMSSASTVSFGLVSIIALVILLL